MAGEMVCPRCRAVVVPSRDAQGGLHCPACNDTGVIQAPPPSGWGQPAPPPTAPATYGAPPNADGAILALVFGIMALAIPYVGIVFGILALVYAKKADQAITASGGQLQGRGMVMAGRILGVIGLVLWSIALLIILSAVVFVLVSNVGSTDGETVPNVAFSKDESGVGGSVTAVQVPSGLDWSDFGVTGSADCLAPFGRMEAGDAIECRSPGLVEIVHLPTNTLVYATTFQD